MSQDDVRQWPITPEQLHRDQREGAAREIVRLARERDDARAERDADRLVIASLRDVAGKLDAENDRLRALLESALPVVQASAQGYAPSEQSLVERIKAALEGR